MKTNQDAKIKIIIDKMKQKGSLPALSENTKDLSRLTQSLSSCASDLASVIMRDCGLTTSILVTVNSSYYSPQYPIKTVSTAVTLLGFEKIRALALGMSIFQSTAKSITKPELRTLYANSYFSGSMSMQLAREFEYSNPEEIFIAGLLHKLPILALTNTFPKKFAKLESLMKIKNISFEKAVLEIFDISYSKLSKNIHSLFNLPGKVTEILENKITDSDPLKSLVNSAGVFSDMLFGMAPGGKEAMEKEEENIKKVLKQDFKFQEFMKTTCENDKNIMNFFNLEPDDIEIMVNVLKWGKIPPAQIVSKLAFGDALEEVTKKKDDPEKLIGHFLTELSLAFRRNYDINQILMLAQEAIFNCVVEADVFIAFVNRKDNFVNGKFYTGPNLLIKAPNFKINLNRNQSAIIKTVEEGVNKNWKFGESSLGLSVSLIKRLQCKHALILPIKVQNRTVGVYFISRRNISLTFSELEETWIEQIIAHVEKIFIQK